MATELLKAHSSVSIDVNAERICSNMTNAKFGELVLDCRDDAVHMINLRLQDLRRWSLQDRTRAESWFGRCDDATRQRLIDGLTAISRVLKNLTPANFVRWDPLRATHISCSPNTNNSFGAVAEVCAPDTVSHTIAIRDAFCEMRPMSYAKDSMVSTLIHEASHFNDTMATKDWKYFMRECLPFARTNPDQAIENADSVTGYVIYRE